MPTDEDINSMIQGKRFRDGSLASQAFDGRLVLDPHRRIDRIGFSATCVCNPMYYSTGF